MHPSSCTKLHQAAPSSTKLHQVQLNMRQPRSTKLHQVQLNMRQQLRGCAACAWPVAFSTACASYGLRSLPAHSCRLLGRMDESAVSSGRGSIRRTREVSPIPRRRWRLRTAASVPLMQKYFPLASDLSLRPPTAQLQNGSKLEMEK